MQRARALLTAVTTLLLLPTVSAIEGPNFKEMGKVFEMIGRGLSGVLSNEYAVYFVTVLLAFMLFYVVFAVPAKNLHFFQGEGGLGLNKMGQLFCVALSGLTCTAIFAFETSAGAAAGKFLAPFGVWGALIFFILVFLLVRNGFRDQTVFGMGGNWLAFLAGLSGMWFFGHLVGSEGIRNLGFAFFILFIFLWIVVKIGTRNRHVTPRQIRQAAATEEGEAAEAQRVTDEQHQRGTVDQQELTRMQQELSRLNQESVRDNRIIRDLATRLRAATEEGEP